MDNALNYYEYSYKRKKQFHLMRALIVLGIPIVPPFIILAIFGLPALLFMSVYWMVSIAVIIYLLKFTRQEFEYIIAGGEMTFSVIYDNTRRKDLLTAKISEMTKIAPYEEKYLSELPARDTMKLFEICDSLKGEDLYFFTTKHEKLGDILVIFNCTAKAAQIMRFYNRPNIVVKDKFIH